ncbi:unnamed protein product [Parnassius apollo]|uniref:(apollo) hypothetical protein n=1 Tax=Parnassius apollo TaxID=110799 RepID=A0A8S3W489_PARAO|nr:unnamed protein product [Parnassius apollo]
MMGHHILPFIDFYWSFDPGFRVNEIADKESFFHCSYLKISTSYILRYILRCLHLNDNTKQPKKDSPDYDKLYKVRPILHLFNQACQDNAEESCSQSIDESMILFKERSFPKQYMPLKPIKRGYKVWCRCDSQTSYLYEFDIYTGKTSNSVEEGLGANVVKKTDQETNREGSTERAYNI